MRITPRLFEAFLKCPTKCTTLVISGDTLYGTAYNGGSGGMGTIFALNTNGTGFTVLHNFSPTSNHNSDGTGPTSLILSGNTLYGTAGGGGSGGVGTVFRLSTNGTDFAVVHSFTSFPTSPPFTNSDGAYPQASLTFSGNTLFGTASSGGDSGNGTVFAVNADGTDFTVLYTFGGKNDGAFPSDLIFSDYTLFGVAYLGGVGGQGTVFSLSFSPQLTIIPSGANVILTWPTNVVGFDYTGFTLQSTTNLASPIWTTNLPAPVIVNGQNTVTNPISGTQQFFRLRQ